MAHRLKEHLDKIAPLPEKTTPPTEDFSQIELTPEEEQEALRLFKEKKYYDEKRRLYWEGVNAEPDILYFTTNQLGNRLKASKNQHGKPFVIDDDNRAIVKLVCQYFAGDPEFEQSQDLGGRNYSLTKGLCLMGNVGVGKSHLMAFFIQNQNQSYTMANCRKIEGAWVEESSSKDKPGKGVIERYSTAFQTAVNSNPFGHQALGVCFDDLGTETTPSKAYGEEKHVLAEILMNRYESGLPFNYTHITTNLSAHDVEIKYGTRVRDRFREMFNLIQFGNEAKSRRS